MRLEEARRVTASNPAACDSGLLPAGFLPEACSWVAALKSDEQWLLGHLQGMVKCRAYTHNCLLTRT